VIKTTVDFPASTSDNCCILKENYMAAPNRTTPIDTKVLVSKGEGVWEVRYFAGMSSQNTPLMWGDGSTSATLGAKAYGWKYCTIAEDAAGLPEVPAVPPNLATLEQRIADLVETVGALQKRLDKQLNQ
jgi:hypothetical protein